MIEIDSCSPMEILKLQSGLSKIADGEGIAFVTEKGKEDIGKYYNMKHEVFEEEAYYVCHDGRQLHHIRTEKKQQDGYVQTIEVYGCPMNSGRI